MHYLWGTEKDAIASSDITKAPFVTKLHLLAVCATVLLCKRYPYLLSKSAAGVWRTDQMA